MPPPHKHDKKHPHLHVPSSKALRFLDRDRLQRLLSTLVANEGDRRFVERCLVDEGPLHHRGANYLLLALLERALALVPGTDAPLEGAGVPMRLPPHLEDDIEDGEYPLPLATHAISELVGGDEKALDAAIDCLTDGPPQHALANVVMVAMLERLLARLEARK